MQSRLFLQLQYNLLNTGGDFEHHINATIDERKVLSPQSTVTKRTVEYLEELRDTETVWLDELKIKVDGIRDWKTLDDDLQQRLGGLGFLNFAANGVQPNIDALNTRYQELYDIIDVAQNLRNRVRTMDANAKAQTNLDAVYIHHLRGMRRYIRRLLRQHGQEIVNISRASKSHWETVLSIEVKNADEKLDGDWVGPWQLGKGSHGVANIWVKQDANQVIVDVGLCPGLPFPHTDSSQRVVVKDTNNANGNDKAFDPGTSTWQSAGDMPLEVAVMLKLRDLASPNPIVSIRNWTNKITAHYANYSQLRYRIYTEYCSSGDLFHLSHMHHPRIQGSYLDEYFLWSLLDGLATAGQVLERGAPGEDKLGLSQIWDVVVHGDMKSDNIFLTENPGPLFPGYPMPKLGDFGLAVVFPKRNFNPDGWVSFHGSHAAPEQCKSDHLNPTGNTPYVPNSKANVWGVGFAMRELLGLTGNVQLWEDYGEGNPTSPPDFDQWVYAQYNTNSGRELLAIIRRCLQVNPANRPTFDEIRRKVVEQSVAEPDLGRVRDRKRGHEIAFGATMFRHPAPRTRRDRYAVGVAVDPAWFV
jgi:hypothetical protein